MYRREALATAGVLASGAGSGCVTLDDVLGGSELERTVSANAVDDVGETHPFSIEVELQSRTMGPDTIPKLTITLENTVEEAQFLGYTESWPADGLLPERNSEPRGLRLLAESEQSDLTVESGRCPTTDFRPITDDRSAGHRVGPGTAYPVTYAAVGSAQELDAPCPAAGTYRFQSPYTYALATEVEELGWESADRSTFSWGFSLELSEAA